MSKEQTLAERLQQALEGDHARLCHGHRPFACTCGFDQRRDEAISDALDALAAPKPSPSTAEAEPVAVKPLEWDDEGFGELLEELRDASKSPHVAQPLADLFGEAFDALMDLNRLVDDLAAAEKKRSARCSAVDITTLQWREYPNEYYPDVFGHCWDAETPFGRYEIAEASGSDSPYYNVCFGTSFVADKDGLPDAKAAAQADYEARIRAALATPLTEGGERNAVIEEWPGQNYEAYERVHNAAIAAYEAAPHADYRYSASALRRAVDAAIRALSSQAQTTGGVE